MRGGAGGLPYRTFQAVVKSGLSSSKVEVMSTNAEEQMHHQVSSFSN